MLLLVLIIGAMSLSIGTSIALGSVGELSMGYSDIQSKKVLALVDSCAQETLLRLWTSANYTGGTLSLPTGACTVAISGGGSARQMSVTATVGRWTESAVIQVDLSGSRLSITDWKRN